MRPYLDLLARVRREGVRRADRTGTGTLGLFGHQLRFDLGAGFPLVTTKRVHFRSMVHELLWFLSGGRFTLIPNRFGRFGPTLTA